MPRIFKTITNNTSSLLRLSYWGKKNGINQMLNTNLEIGKITDVPINDTTGEFFVEFENYSRLMKFRTKITSDGTWMWVYDGGFNFSLDPISKNISVVSQ